MRDSIRDSLNYSIPIAIVIFFVGIIYCTMYGNHPVLFPVGYYITAVGLTVLIAIGLFYANDSFFFGLISTLTVVGALFFFSCLVGIAPFMPQTPDARNLYLWLSIPLMIFGGGTTTVRVIIIIIL